MSSKNTTRYFLFNRSTHERTGLFKPVKNAATREEARDYKRESVQRLAIYDRWSDMVVR